MIHEQKEKSFKEKLLLSGQSSIKKSVNFANDVDVTKSTDLTCLTFTGKTATNSSQKSISKLSECNNMVVKLSE